MPAIAGQLKGSYLTHRLLHYYNYTYLDLQNSRALPVRSTHARKCPPVSLSPSPCGAAQPAARRSLGCSEGIPDRRVCPDGLGGHVAFRVPARKRVKHIWTLWGAVSGQLKRALAELHRRGERRCESPPVRAGPRFESGLGCEPVGAPWRDSRGESSPCAVGAAPTQLRLCW